MENVKKINIDMHIHSSKSDGIHSPKAICEMVKAAKLVKFSITDHDDVSSVAEVKKVMQGSSDYTGIIYVPGIEVSVAAFGKNCHLLGYGFNPEAPSIVQLIEASKRIRKLRTRQTILHLESKGIMFPLATRQEILKGDGMLKRHIIDLAIRSDLTKLSHDVFRASYLDDMDTSRVMPIAESIQVLNKKQPGVIDAIKSAGGQIVSLSHPIEVAEQYRLTNAELDAWIGKLRDAGLNAIEVFSSHHTEEQIKTYHGIADKYKLMETQGSNFRGGKDGIELGQIMKSEEPLKTKIPERRQ